MKEETLNPETLGQLRSTRTLNFCAAFFLSLQFYGNLYEENGAIANVTRPVPGSLISPLEPGSPLYFYLPWVPIGIVLAVVLFFRTRKFETKFISQDILRALALLTIVIGCKVFLVTQVNDTFRDSTVSKEHFIAMGWLWLCINGIATLAAGLSIWMLIRWRRLVLSAPAQAGLHIDSDK